MLTGKGLVIGGDRNREEKKKEIFRKWGRIAKINRAETRIITVLLCFRSFGWQYLCTSTFKCRIFTC